MINSNIAHGEVDFCEEFIDIESSTNLTQSESLPVGATQDISQFIKEPFLRQFKRSHSAVKNSIKYFQC